MFFRIQPGLPQKCWSHQLPRGVLRPKTDPELPSAPSKAFFPHFLCVQNSVENLDGPKTTSSRDFCDFWSPRRRFATILGPKQIPGAYFFSIFLKPLILLKSCSRCGGSTIFKV